MHLKQFQDLAHIEFKLFDLPIEELLIRNSKRTRKVPKKVFENMFHQLQNLKIKFDFKSIRRNKSNVEYSTKNQDLPKVIIYDMDGTLALMNGRNAFDASRCEEDVLKNYKNLGYKIILRSGQEDKFEAATLKFLSNNSIEFYVLLLNKFKRF